MTPIIPLEDQASFLVPMVYTIGFYSYLWYERGRLSKNKKYRRTCIKHVAFWSFMFVLMVLVTVLTWE